MSAPTLSSIDVSSGSGSGGAFVPTAAGAAAVAPPPPPDGRLVAGVWLGLAISLLLPPTPVCGGEIWLVLCAPIIELPPLVPSTAARLAIGVRLPGAKGVLVKDWNWKPDIAVLWAVGSGWAVPALQRRLRSADLADPW